MISEASWDTEDCVMMLKLSFASQNKLHLKYIQLEYIYFKL